MPDEEQKVTDGSDDESDTTDNTDSSESDADLDADEQEPTDDDGDGDADLSAEVETLRGQVAGLTDLMTAKDSSSQRQMGQVKGLQSSISKLETATKGSPTAGRVDALTTAVTTLVEALAEDLPKGASEKITSALAEGRQGEALAEAVQQVRSELETDQDTGQAETSDDGLEPHEVATLRVLDYAEGKGLSQTEVMTAIPRTTWVEVQQSTSSMTAAVTALKKKVDDAVEQKAASGRRSSKKAEGSKGANTVRSASGAGLPTKKQLAGMTLEEVMKIKPDDRAKILAS